jgi:hypothetical protein
MKRFLSSIIFASTCIGLGLALATPADASSVSTRSVFHDPIRKGGMTRNHALLRKTSIGPALMVGGSPLCGLIVCTGTAGYIAVQTSPGGVVSWGIYMYNPQNRYGVWVARVYVGKRQVDRKAQSYELHGSVIACRPRRDRSFLSPRR